MQMRGGLLQAFIRVKSTSGMPGFGTLQCNQHSTEFNASIPARARREIGSWLTKNDRNSWELHEATRLQEERDLKTAAKTARAEAILLKTRNADMGSFPNEKGEMVKLGVGQRLRPMDFANMHPPSRISFFESLNRGQAGNGFTIEVLKNHLTLINAEGGFSKELLAAMPSGMKYPLLTTGTRQVLVTRLLSVLAAETSVEEADRALEEQADHEEQEEEMLRADASGGGGESNGGGDGSGDGESNGGGEGVVECEQDAARASRASVGVPPPAPAKRRRVTDRRGGAAANPSVQTDVYVRVYPPREPRKVRT
jgi:hypothetical protein